LRWQPVIEASRILEVDQAILARAWLLDVP